LLWGYHQLHCLVSPLSSVHPSNSRITLLQDTIRQGTWLDVYRNEYNMTPEGLDGPDYLVRMHVGKLAFLLRLSV
jgi:hypothetical protein